MPAMDPGEHSRKDSGRGIRPWFCARAQHDDQCRSARRPRRGGQCGFEGLFPNGHLPARERNFSIIGLFAVCKHDPRAALHRVPAPAGLLRQARIPCGNRPRALPQGACTSPALSNLVTRKFDARLRGISQKLGFTYTRYADDLTFSGTAELTKMAGYLLARVRHIAEDEHFAVNETKTRVQRPSMAQVVTGIVVNQRPNVPRKTVRRMRAILHRAKKEGLAAQNRKQEANFEAKVGGMISYIHMVNPAKGKKLREAFDALAQ